MVKEKRKNAPPEKVIKEKLQGVLMRMLKSVKLVVKRLQTALGRIGN